MVVQRLVREARKEVGVVDRQQIGRTQRQCDAERDERRTPRGGVGGTRGRRATGRWHGPPCSAGVGPAAR
jgi:hypothetical protein